MARYEELNVQDSQMELHWRQNNYAAASEPEGGVVASLRASFMERRTLSARIGELEAQRIQLQGRFLHENNIHRQDEPAPAPEAAPPPPYTESDEIIQQLR